MIELKRGLDLPLAGEPEQRIHEAARPGKVALVAADYTGMKPTLQVREGDRVKRGQVLFTDKKNEAVKFTAPAAGTVSAINRGDKRAFISLEIAVDGDESETFRNFPSHVLATLPREDVQENLLASGLWTALRTRPYDKVPVPGTVPSSIFVNTMDTNPLAAEPDVVMAGRDAVFKAGVEVLSRLTEGRVYVCRRKDARHHHYISGVPRVAERVFGGPHPSGLVGTHIHFLDPVGPHKTVWHLNYQDAIAIGELFLTGKLDTTRVIALAGPQVKKPQLLRTVLGACASDLVRGELEEGDNRVISGSALHGAICSGHVDYLGRYALQITVLREGRERVLFRYIRPGWDMHSASNLVLGKIRGAFRFPFSTTTNGSARAMLPIGTYEQVMPLDILPTWLLRYLVAGDTDRAAALGALELGEEDLALCTYVCPGKYEYGPILRDVLNRIEIEG